MKTEITAEAFLPVKVYEKFPLADSSSFGIGGKARFASYPESAEQIKLLISVAKKCGIRTVVVGNASNILFDSGFIDALIIFTNRMNSVRIDKTNITADCGASLSFVASRAKNAALSGLEFAYGIPGTIGGAIFMNAGAYGGEMANIVESSTVLDIKSEKISLISGKEHLFEYRKSVFSKGEYIILSSTLSLSQGKKEDIEKKMRENISKRREKQPLEFPSAGSIFKRPVNAYAADLIEKSGLKGLRVGNAEVSEKHAGFIINRGGASSDDVLNLIGKIQAAVKEKYGISLETEIIYVN